MEVGIYTNDQLDIEDYHAHRESISRTPMLEFMESPFRYWAFYLNPNAPKKDVTPAMVFGSAFHTLMLEPHLFEQRCIVAPEPVLLKNVGREAYDAYKARLLEIEDTLKMVIKLEDYEHMLRMRDVLMNNPQTRELLSDGINEQSYFWIDPHSGLMVKSRPDILHPNMYVDIKTIRHASPENYQREMASHGYHIQGAMVCDARWHLEGIENTTVINIAIEKDYPYSVGTFIIDEAAIETGHIQYKQTLLDMKEAKARNHYPDYQPQTIGLPRWAL